MQHRVDMNIVALTAADIAARRAELERLLRDAVGHGASVGFTLPFADGEVEDFWRGVGDEVAAGRRQAWAALDRDGALLGAVQLERGRRSNGRHRAEVQKLQVFHHARGRGIGRALMQRLEADARAAGVTLLYLDTSVGPGGATEFYARLGYTHAGDIPDYAGYPDGTLAPTALFYKQL